MELKYHLPFIYFSHFGQSSAVSLTLLWFSPCFFSSTLSPPHSLSPPQPPCPRSWISEWAPSIQEPGGGKCLSCDYFIPKSSSHHNWARQGWTFHPPQAGDERQGRAEPSPAEHVHQTVSNEIKTHPRQSSTGKSECLGPSCFLLALTVFLHTPCSWLSPFASSLWPWRQRIFSSFALATLRTHQALLTPGKHRPWSSRQSNGEMILFNFFVFFLGPNPRHMEVPRLGVKSEL